jgi:hypothetical protein
VQSRIQRGERVQKYLNAASIPSEVSDAASDTSEGILAAFRYF